MTKRGRPKGTTKWTPEEKAILNKCHDTDVYRYTVQLLKIPNNDIKLILSQLEEHITIARKIENAKEREDTIRIYRSIIKNAKRIVSLRMLEEVDIFQEICNLPKIQNEILKLKNKRIRCYLDNVFSSKKEQEEFTEDDEIRLDYLLKLEKKLITIKSEIHVFDEDKTVKPRVFEREFESPEGTTSDMIGDGYEMDCETENEPTVEEREYPKVDVDLEVSMDIEEFWASGGTNYIQYRLKNNPRDRKDIYEDWGYYQDISSQREE